MEQTEKLRKIHDKIRSMKLSAEELKRLGDEFPAISRNMVRIMASLKMLELNVSDLVE